MTTTTLKEKQLLIQVFYSNAREVVEHENDFNHKCIDFTNEIRIILNSLGI